MNNIRQMQSVAQFLDFVASDRHLDIYSPEEMKRSAAQNLNKGWMTSDEMKQRFRHLGQEDRTNIVKLITACRDLFKKEGFLSRGIRSNPNDLNSAIDKKWEKSFEVFLSDKNLNTAYNRNTALEKIKIFFRKLFNPTLRKSHFIDELVALKEEIEDAKKENPSQFEDLTAKKWQTDFETLCQDLKAKLKEVESGLAALQNGSGSLPDLLATIERAKALANHVGMSEKVQQSIELLYRTCKYSVSRDLQYVNAALGILAGSFLFIQDVENEQKKRFRFIQAIDDKAQAHFAENQRKAEQRAVAVRSAPRAWTSRAPQAEPTDPVVVSFLMDLSTELCPLEERLNTRSLSKWYKAREIRKELEKINNWITGKKAEIETLEGTPAQKQERIDCIQGTFDHIRFIAVLFTKHDAVNTHPISDAVPEVVRVARERVAEELIGEDAPFLEKFMTGDLRPLKNKIALTHDVLKLLKGNLEEEDVISVSTGKIARVFEKICRVIDWALDTLMKREVEPEIKQPEKKAFKGLFVKNKQEIDQKVKHSLDTFIQALDSTSYGNAALLHKRRRIRETAAAIKKERQEAFERWQIDLERRHEIQAFIDYTGAQLENFAMLEIAYRLLSRCSQGYKQFSKERTFAYIDQLEVPESFRASLKKMLSDHMPEQSISRKTRTAAFNKIREDLREWMTAYRAQQKQRWVSSITN